MAFVTRTIGDVVSEILMSRTIFSGSLLVIEGDTDSKFFSRRIDKSHCQVIVAGGKFTVLGVVDRAYHVGQYGVLGSVDDDFDSLDGLPLPINIVRTDGRDLECLLLKSPALEIVTSELTDHVKLAAFETTEGVSLRQAPPAPEWLSPL